MGWGAVHLRHQLPDGLAAVGLPQRLSRPPLGLPAPGPHVRIIVHRHGVEPGRPVDPTLALLLRVRAHINQPGQA
eukprot:scaffold647837_cov31-Prasinocladus_malaysianus.AAC.1